MYNENFISGITGHVAEFPTPNNAIIHFDLNGVLQTAFLKTQRFHKNSKHLPDNQCLNKFLKVGHKVKFSCHINDNPEAGQCKWFIINCWRQIESDNKLIMSSGIMNIAGTVTDLKQNQGTLLMVDLMEIEHRVHFLASKVYLYGKRYSASKSLSSQLQIDDKVYFDAIPCFPEENNQNCSWFATCVYKEIKPEIFIYKDSNKTKGNEIDTEKIFNQFNQSVRGETLTSHTDLLIDGINKDVGTLNLNSDASPTHVHQPRNEIAVSLVEPVSKLNKASTETKLTLDLSSIDETELMREDFHLNVDPNRLNAQMLYDIKLLTNDPRTIFAISEGVILDIINEEYGVILGEFQCNVFQSILFHRSNAFLFKMSLAHSKLTEIFIEGDRVRFIAVDAPKKFVCDWIATQVSVACHEEEENEEDQSDDDLSDEDLSDDFED